MDESYYKKGGSMKYKLLEKRFYVNISNSNIMSMRATVGHSCLIMEKIYMKPTVWEQGCGCAIQIAAEEAEDKSFV